MKNKLIKILLPAVGGQGGGVLAEWLIQAFEIENYEVQGISLPGLSQRGGSTIYYMEAFPKGSDEKIIFSQYPLPGDIDLIVAQEFLELGRVLEKGFGSDKTTIVSSTHRIYSTEEKLPITSGIFSKERLEEMAKEFSSKFFGLDVLQIAKDNGMNELSTNAILLGALSSSNAVPINKETFQKGIEAAGVSVKNNLIAFNIGYDYVSKNGQYEPHVEQEENIDEQYKYIKPKDRLKLKELISETEQHYPEYLHSFLSEAVCRLTDYQGVWYAKRYLNEIAAFREQETLNADKDYRLSEYLIKNLALLMSYEDGIRVSELKIRDDRFKRIKKDMQISDGQIFTVVDYLKPDAEEVYGLFPNFIVSPVLFILNSVLFKRLFKDKDSLTISQKPTTTSFLGFFRIWMLSKFKFIRPYSYRFKNEHRTIRLYLDTTYKYAASDYDLGVLSARSGNIIKGYGRVRRRTIDTFTRLINNAAERFFESELKEGKGFEGTKNLFIKAFELISENEDAIEEIEKITQGSSS